MKKMVYPCGWRYVSNAYQIWWLDDPAVGVEAPTFEKAEKAFRVLLSNATGQPTPYYQFVPLRPPASPEVAMFCGEWVLAQPTNAVATPTKPLAQLFENGICGTCHKGIGRRTDSRLEFDYRDLEGADLGAVREGLCRQYVVSDTFAERIIADSDFYQHLRPTDDSGDAKRAKSYFELCPSFSVEVVALKDEESECVVCKTCCRKWIPPLAKNGKVPVYVSQGSMAQQNKRWAIVNNGAKPSIAIRASVLKELNREGLEGVEIQWLGEIPLNLQVVPQCRFL